MWRRWISVGAIFSAFFFGSISIALSPTPVALAAHTTTIVVTSSSAASNGREVTDPGFGG